MNITFTHDFQGKLTHEMFFRAGTTIDIDEEIGAELIALGHAVAADFTTVPGPVGAPEPDDVVASFFAEPPVDPPGTDNPVTEKGSRRGKPA